VDEDFTKKSTCLLCDAKVDPKSDKSEVQICSTCAIVAMSDEAFQNLDYISLIVNVKPKSFNDRERKRIFDLYIPAHGLRLIETNYH
jgi:ribosome-binding protein aMBF1 (putative translation factor)